jgi:hypothetical protein
MKQLFTLVMFTDDMGSFKQPGCVDMIDALWHVNSARLHDNLTPYTMEKFEKLFTGVSWGYASLSPQY